MRWPMLNLTEGTSALILCKFPTAVHIMCGCQLSTLNKDQSRCRSWINFSSGKEDQVQAWTPRIMPACAGLKDFLGSSLGAIFTPNSIATSEKTASYNFNVLELKGAAVQQSSKCWQTISWPKPDLWTSMKRTILARWSKIPALLTPPKMRLYCLK